MWREGPAATRRQWIKGEERETSDTIRVDVCFYEGDRLHGFKQAGLRLNDIRLIE